MKFILIGQKTCPGCVYMIGILTKLQEFDIDYTFIDANNFPGLIYEVPIIYFEKFNKFYKIDVHKLNEIAREIFN